MLDLLVNISSAILALTGFVSVALTNQLNPLISLLGSVFVTIALFFYIFNIRPRIFKIIHKSIWDAVIIIAFFIMIIDLFWISGSLLISIIHLSVILMINKLFNLNTRKDYTQLYLISLLQFLAASTMTTRLYFAFIVIAFLISATWTLILFHLKFQTEERENAGQSNVIFYEKIVDLPFFFSTNMVALAAFLITIIIFFLIPRFGIGFLQKKNDDRLRTSGFSERIDLGDIAPIKLDNSMVMRVRIPDYNESLKDKIYWRGVTFDSYNGRSWSNNLSLRFNPEINEEGEFIINEPERNIRPPHNAGSNKSGSFASADHSVEKSPEEGINKKGIYQEIILEPLDTTVLFAASHVEKLSIRLPSIKEDIMGSIYTPYAPFSRLQYSAYSRLDSVSEEDKLLESIAYPPDIGKIYLQVPAGSEEIEALAKEITSNSKTILSKILTIERYLKENYRYTLDVKPETDKNPIEDFLFRQKAGYCEYYATAMVLMLRSIGIPSRLVTGFLTGEWNEIGGYFTVRQKDAHAWVEAYFPRSGWVTFDPTPPALLNEQKSTLNLISKFIDSLRLRWDRYIINYSMKDQLEAVKKTREKINSLQGDLLRLYESIRRLELKIREGFAIYSQTPKRSAFFLLASAPLLLVFCLYLYIKKGYRPSLIHFTFRSDKNSQIVELYKRMLKLLERRGIAKKKNITPLEFASSIAIHDEQISRGVLEITKSYYKVRFGHQSLSKDEISRISEMLLKIKKGFPRQ